MSTPLETVPDVLKQALNPLVSVILPVYNTEKYVADAIKSVLAQTDARIELICVNDGSTDGSLEILRSFGDTITLIDLEKNQGIAHARNCGIRVAKGEFIAFMDADDLWEPTKLKKQCDAFLSHPEIDICFTLMNCFLSPELPDEVKAIRFCPPGANIAQTPPATLVRTAAFHRVGFFDPKWRVGEFIDWIERAKGLPLTTFCVQEVLIHRRIHETNTGVRDRDARSDYLRIIKESLERRRGQTV